MPDRELSLGWVALNIGIKESTAELGLGGGNIWAHAGADLRERMTAYQADPRKSVTPAAPPSTSAG